MKIYTFNIEVVDEISGQYMNFPYEYESYDDENNAQAEDSVTQEVLSNLSIVPRLISVESDRA